MGALDGHKTIVTGGGAGIGEAICRRFAAEGAQVAVLDRRLDSAQAVANEIGGIAFECDVADAAAVEGAVGRVFDEFGTVTDLVNNAGMGMNKPLHRYRDEEWALVMAVNLTGTFHCMRAVIPDARFGRRQHREQRVAERRAAAVGRGALLRGQGRGDQPHDDGGGRVRPDDPRELRVARPHRDAAHVARHVEPFVARRRGVGHACFSASAPPTRWRTCSRSSAPTRRRTSPDRTS